MKLSLKLVVAFTGLLCFLPTSRAALNITWSTGGNLNVLKDSFDALLPGSSTLGVGGFIQLIYDGGDGLDGFDIGQNNGLISGGNDILLGTASVGVGLALASQRPGDFSRTTANVDTVPGYTPAAGQQLYIRFFDTASTSFGTGLIPQTGYYANIAASTLLLGTDIVVGDANITFTTPTQTMTPVPEPSTLALCLIGGLTAAGLRRRRNRK